VWAPLVEGAFVGMLVAEALDVPFTYAERGADAAGESLFPARYTVPRALRGEVAGKRVAIANDVVNAGSAVRATLADLLKLGARPVALGTLAVLGSAAAELAARERLALEALAAVSDALWKPRGCPPCPHGRALEH